MYVPLHKNVQIQSVKIESMQSHGIGNCVHILMHFFSFAAVSIAQTVLLHVHVLILSPVKCTLTSLPTRNRTNL